MLLHLRRIGIELAQRLILDDFSTVNDTLALLHLTALGSDESNLTAQFVVTAYAVIFQVGGKILVDVTFLQLRPHRTYLTVSKEALVCHHRSEQSTHSMALRHFPRHDTDICRCVSVQTGIVILRDDTKRIELSEFLSHK